MILEKFCKESHLKTSCYKGRINMLRKLKLKANNKFLFLILSDVYTDVV